MTLIKRTDKIVLTPFIKLFILVLSVTVFIMLMQFFLIYFDELIGKDLGFWVYVQLFCYFGINATPMAFPLATLVSSLMVFGSLGEQLELTALKSAGIPFIRILRPLLFLVTLLSIFVYFSNGYIVPKVTVKAHTLLYDLRKKKPSIAIKEGVFYNGIPDYSIRVERKLPDQKTLEDIVIYDHTKNKGNVHMTTASFGQLTTINNGQYLVIELFNGHNYLEKLPEKKDNKTSTASSKVIIPNFYRTSFKAQKVLIDLDAFKLTRTNEKYFTYYHSTKTTKEIIKDISKMQSRIKKNQTSILKDFQKHYHLPALDHTNLPANHKETAAVDNIDITDTSSHQALSLQTDSKTIIAPSVQEDNVVSNKIPITHDLANNPKRSQIIQKALEQVKELRYKIQPYTNKITSVDRKLKEFQIEKNKRTSYAIGCILMLLIGASLGALIKKGGFGIPLLISTVFILLYYMVDIFGTKWAKVDIIDTISGAWAPNIVLLPFGLFFLRQAQKDTRLLEGDAYRIFWRKLKKSIARRKK
ncbi:permease YjgP/YjgQ family protein [Candidatus Amoebophilus asiaticus 5a2]|uniref:Permease YjgP/YjgQ family protein n=1 Tax=Amoebophilus asiaticus (strain 5a2) TaxID=452471 RepID=B3EU49_AMOA5|nr:LptF/LptG family permease [Candidatus Amoebophilus asiaticus]ACE05468.1 permease YjgP/YjgQ family protein [Candidatus Amoebophilus asiaticus 5a2]